MCVLKYQQSNSQISLVSFLMNLLKLSSHLENREAIRKLGTNKFSKNRMFTLIKHHKKKEQIVKSKLNKRMEQVHKGRGQLMLWMVTIQDKTNTSQILYSLKTTDKIKTIVIKTNKCRFLFKIIQLLKTVKVSEVQQALITWCISNLKECYRIQASLMKALIDRKAWSPIDHAKELLLGLKLITISLIIHKVVLFLQQVFLKQLILMFSNLVNKNSTSKANMLGQLMLSINKVDLLV